MTTHASHPVSIIVYAKDCAALARFYESVFDLQVAQRDPGFVRLGLGMLELTVVQAPAAIADSIEIATPPEPREETPIKLSFLVADFEASRARIVVAGGVLQPAERAWTWNGARHLDGWDSEGNVFQLRSAGA